MKLPSKVAFAIDFDSWHQLPLDETEMRPVDRRKWRQKCRSEGESGCWGID